MKNKLNYLLTIIIVTFSFFPVNAQFKNKFQPTETIFKMPKGHFFENIATGPDQDFYITDYTGKAIYRYTKESGLVLFKTISGHPVSLRFDMEGNGLLSVHHTPIFAGPDFTKSMALYRINTKGEISLFREMPEAAFLNGITSLNKDTYLVGDAIKGIIWKVNMKTNKVSIWLKSELLTQKSSDGHIPGVNGIQVHGKEFYAVNGDRGLILKADINQSLTPNNLKVIHENIVIDDFVLDDKKNIYATTHGDNILKIDANGTITVLAGLEQNAIGSTAAQLGIHIGDPNSLYVVTDGGLIFGNDIGARILRIDLGK